VVPFCVDCSFYKEVDYNPAYGCHLCSVNQMKETDIVTGKVYDIGNENCYKMRGVNGPCGPKGELFKRKD